MCAVTVTEPMWPSLPKQSASFSTCAFFVFSWYGLTVIWLVLVNDYFCYCAVAVLSKMVGSVQTIGQDRLAGRGNPVSEHYNFITAVSC